MEWRCDIVPENSENQHCIPRPRLIPLSHFLRSWLHAYTSCFFKLHYALSMLTISNRNCLIAVTSKGEFILHTLRYFDTYLQLLACGKSTSALHGRMWQWTRLQQLGTTVSGSPLGWALSPAHVSSLLHHR